MKVSEIKELLPLSEVYELRFDVKYLVLTDHTAMSLNGTKKIAEFLSRHAELKIVLLHVGDVRGVKILGVEDVK